MRNFVLCVALGAMHSVQGALTVCNADNCLRAVRNTQFPVRGSTDCASYLAQTVTASATTITTTVTITSSPSATSSATEIDTVSFGTLTSTELDTLTITPTVTITSTTSTETSVATSVVFARRDAPSGSIPAYASLCSGAARYTSACACIGVSVSTVTVPGPTSYTGVTVTSTLPTAIVLTTETFSTTIPATSTTETDIDTVYAPAATSIVDVDALTTVTSVSTSTTSLPSPTAFCLTASAKGVDYVVGQSGQAGLNFIAKTVGTASPPTVMFTLDSAGHLVSAAGYNTYVISPFNDPQVFRLETAQAVNSQPTKFAPLICSGTIGGTLSCTATPPTGPVVNYSVFARDNQFGILNMGSNPAIDPTRDTVLTFKLSTTCPV
ncbi:hypothetical protein EG329_008423 [Mollisiaceae sp. DMI_Dod_QoI]|nr:hypothetical protein EG329_008423 [Helotiales sp. DMI_Dod_QoI]